MSKKIPPSRITVVATRTREFRPTWVHTHQTTGFVLGFKGSSELITVPAGAVDWVVVECESPEAVESLFEGSGKDDSVKGE